MGACKKLSPPPLRLGPREWIRTLEKLGSLDAETIVPGHGEDFAAFRERILGEDKLDVPFFNYAMLSFIELVSHEVKQR